MSELESANVELIPDGDVPGAVDDLGRIGELIGRDAPDQPTDGDDGSADEPESELPDAQDADNPEMGAADGDELDGDEVEQEQVALDYDQIVPMPGDGEPVTVGQLKDFYQGKVEHDQQRETWEAHRVEQDSKHIANKQQLTELANMVAQVDPQMAAYLQQQRGEYHREQAKALLDVFPEWRDPAVKAAQAPAIKAAAMQLGFSEAEYAQIDDHRQIRGLHLFAKLLAREAAGKAAKEAIQAKLPKGQKPARRKISAAQEKRNKLARAKTGTADQKNEAISALINGA